MRDEMQKLSGMAKRWRESSVYNIREFFKREIYKKFGLVAKGVKEDDV